MQITELNHETENNKEISKFIPSSWEPWGDETILCPRNHLARNHSSWAPPDPPPLTSWWLVQGAQDPSTFHIVLKCKSGPTC